MIFDVGNVRQKYTQAPEKVLRMPREMATEKALQLLRRVGLEDRADAYPIQPSGSIMSARTMATRCFWPPESWMG